MKRILASLTLIVIACSVHAQMNEGSVLTASNGTIHFLYFTPPNYRSSGTGHPLIISLGGVGERGDGSSLDLQNLYIGGIPKKIKDGSNMVFSYGATTDGFVVLAPQISKTSDWQNYYVDEMITYGLSHFNVDPNRIFLTGYSLGGGGTWQYAVSSPNVNKLAGIVPISAGFPSNPNYCNIAGNKVAVWAFQGALDNVYPGDVANVITNQIDQCATLDIPAFDSTFADEVHGADFWDNKVYSPTNNILPANVFQWMLKVSRGLDLATNQVPVPVINGATTYTFPAPFKTKDFPVLDGSGSYDNDDIVVNYLWSQTGGPTVNLPRSQWPITTVTDPSNNIGMAAGNYSFVLRVKDYLTSKVNSSGNHTQTATVNVNITLPASGHAAPATDAGGTITISSTTTELRQIGNAFPYGCANPAQGCFSGYNWSQLPQNPGNPQDGGPAVSLLDYNNGSIPYSPGAGEVRIGNITNPGTYRFQYSATNKFGETGSDILTVVKLAALPVNYSYFNARNAGSKNILGWATTAEVNSERFDIQRSTDGTNFEVIGSLSSKGGSVLTTYTFDDNSAPSGLSYYRLSQVDKDGHSALSQTVSANNRNTGLYIEKYPNPAHDNLTVSVQGNINGTMQVLIADMQGKAVLQQQWKKDLSSLKKVISIATLQNGLYQLIITVGNQKQISSFVKY